MTSSFDWDAFYATSLVTAGIDDADALDPDTDVPLLEPGPDERWSTWPQTARTLDRGPQPHPSWVVQHAGAIDTELGMLKSGKEADAHLLRRALPEPERRGADGESTLLVAKRYRSAEHSSFHRSAQYTEGRRVKDSREARAIAKGTRFGKEAAAERWARAEFDMLCRLHEAGLPVPYPVQILGTELCMEFVGALDGEQAVAGSRLQEARPSPELLEQWAEQLHSVVMGFAALGLAHGDLSPYNVLVDPRSPQQDLVVIDVPQTVDVIANPSGEEFLRRDCRNLCAWLLARGVDPRLADEADWAQEALSAAMPSGMRPGS